MCTLIYMQFKIWKYIRGLIPDVKVIKRNSTFSSVKTMAMDQKMLCDDHITRLLQWSHLKSCMICRQLKRKRKMGSVLLMVELWRKLSGKRQSCCISSITCWVRIPLSVSCTQINGHHMFCNSALTGEVFPQECPHWSHASSAFLSESMCMYAAS